MKLSEKASPKPTYHTPVHQFVRTHISFIQTRELINQEKHTINLSNLSKRFLIELKHNPPATFTRNSRANQNGIALINQGRRSRVLASQIFITK